MAIILEGSSDNSGHQDAAVKTKEVAKEMK